MKKSNDCSAGAGGKKLDMMRQCAAGMMGWNTGIFFGLSIAYVSAGMDSFQREYKAGRAPFKMENVDVGTFGSSMSLGGIIGSAFSGLATRRLGRKPPCLFSYIPYTVGWALIAFPVNFNMLIAGQALCGFAQGIRAPSSRIYVAEISHPRHRAQFVSGSYTSSLAVQVIIYLAALALSWQKLAIACGLLPLLALLFELRAPESPVWLLANGRAEEARKSMQWVYGDEYDIDEEFQEVVNHQNDTKEALARWTDIFHLRYMWPLFIVSVFMLLRQFTGGIAINTFMSQVFREAKATLDPKYCIIILGVVQFFATSLSGVIMDKIGRRQCVIISGMLMGLAEAALGVIFYLEEEPSTRHLTKSINWLPPILVILTMIGFMMGMATSVFVLVSEIIPLQIKGEANALFNILNSGSAYLVLTLYHRLLDGVRASGTFWIFSACCFLVVGFLATFLPETKGKTLGHIERSIATGNGTESESVKA